MSQLNSPMTAPVAAPSDAPAGTGDERHARASRVRPVGGCAN